MNEQRQEPHFSEAATTAASSSDTPTQPTPQSPAPTTRRRWLRIMFWGVTLIFLTVLALLCGAWWWSGQPGSLQQTLTQAARWMPAQQQLQSRDVQGSLRHGGQIAWLRWSSPSMQVEVKNARIAWSLRALLQRELRIDQLHVQALHLLSTPQPKDDSPLEPLQSVSLPLHINLPWRVDFLRWEGPPTVEVYDLQGRYRYTGSHHEAQITSLRYDQGSYEADVQLQAVAPMQLQAALKGSLKAPLPGETSANDAQQQPLTQPPGPALDIQAQAHITGTLATEAANLQVQLNAHTVVPEKMESQSASQQPLSAEVQAHIRPWQSQPLEQARAKLQHVDVARFLAQGPRTDLNGLIEILPQAAGAWNFQADVSNTLPGPWDKQALPVRQLIAKAGFDGAHIWQLTEAQIFLPTQQDGQFQAQGSYDTATGALQGQATLQAINPASLYSTLDSSPLNGQIAAVSTQPATIAQTETPIESTKKTVSPHIQFTLDIEAQGRARPGALRIDAARAKGTWQAPHLQLRDVYLQALHAQLQSPTLEINSDNLHLAGKATLQVPGAQVALDGHMAPDNGQGKLQLQLQSAGQLMAWLRELPVMPQTLTRMQLAGQGTAAVQWNGGWHKLQQRLQDPGAPIQASGLQLEAQVNVPQLRHTSSDGSISEVQRLQLRLQGSPEKLQANLATQAYLNEQVLQLDTALNAGLRTGQGVGPVDWQAQIQRLNVRWQPDAKGAAWQAALLVPLALSQHTQGNSSNNTRITASEGHLQVTPPDRIGQQQASVQWQPLVARQAGTGTWAVQSKGVLQNVPLAWVDAFSPDMSRPLLASAGISGDLILQGQWDIDTTGRQWRTNVQIERASGDVRLAVEDSDTAPITAVRSSGATGSNDAQARQIMQVGRGVRARLQELRLNLGIQGNQLRANLVMTSERAGQMHMDMQSQLRSTSAGLIWPDNAPLSGRIRADLPNIGFWALFAPPGWRVGGTFNADVQIAGTRQNPQWNGMLQADALSISSLLDGVNLNNGRLRARLQDTRLDITELYLQGGKGSSARILGMSGNLTAAPEDGGTLTGSGHVAYNPQAPQGSSGIEMDIRAQAKQLQVLVRADRQLSTSGSLNATMHQGQITLRGDLTVDRAAILLADESAPKLDSDVHIHSAASRKLKAKAEQIALQKKNSSAPSPEPSSSSMSAEGSVQAAKEPDILVKLDLGPDFALQGYGITTRLQGQLAITGGPRITGEIHTVHGRYRAWGQSLDVEKGTILFNGPYDNPSIDIWAVRPNIAVRAGVKVTGNASSPRVALFSEPEMSDAEKLSWVVMGRDTSNGGAETALLQQAALALLSGGGTGENFAGRVGLDEIGFQGGGDGNNAEGAALTLGKRLSQDLYVSYQQSLSGAMGTLYIFYDLSRRLTLRGQTGEQTAVDLIYTRKKD